jgi:hypothetical protein
MTEERKLLRAVQRLMADKESAKRLMAAPRETVTTELGISRESYDALVALVPVLLAGGLFVASGGLAPGVDPSGVVNPEWGKWTAP